MGYFSNGTEGDLYQKQYCRHCRHWPDDPDDGGCPVWLAHLMYNYEAVGKGANQSLAGVLEILIPRDGIHNGECTMFIARDPNRCVNTKDMFVDE